MNTLNVTAHLNGLEDLEKSLLRAHEVLGELDEAVLMVRRNFGKLGVTLDQPADSAAE